VEVIVIKNERHISLLRRYKDLKNDKKDWIFQLVLHIREFEELF
jgi:hypothetical protein